MVRDRAGQFTDGFDAVLSAAGIEYALGCWNHPWFPGVSRAY
jgi:hypothetical protein